MAEAKASAPLPQLPLAVLLAACALSVAPHTQWLPLWTSIAAGGLLAWRSAAIVRGSLLPHRWLLLFLTLATIAGVFFSYRTIIDRKSVV